jgi:hypothetical protein
MRTSLRPVRFLGSRGESLQIDEVQLPIKTKEKTLIFRLENPRWAGFSPNCAEFIALVSTVLLTANRLCLMFEQPKTAGGRTRWFCTRQLNPL